MCSLACRRVWHAQYADDSLAHLHQLSQMYTASQLSSGYRAQQPAAALLAWVAVQLHSLQGDAVVSYAETILVTLYLALACNCVLGHGRPQSQLQLFAGVHLLAAGRSRQVRATKKLQLCMLVQVHLLLNSSASPS